MIRVLVDADACPVKEEIYRVAKRHGARVVLVANSVLPTPGEEWIDLVVVGKGANLADDWIVTAAGPADLVVTGDIPLAARLVPRGIRVLGLKGLPFTEDGIGDALATRDLLTDLRASGVRTRGPAAFEPRDRSRFLQALDTMLVALVREGRRPPPVPGS